MGKNSPLPLPGSQVVSLLVARTGNFRASLMLITTIG